jgi:S-adenosylmethionine decarboxylase
MEKLKLFGFNNLTKSLCFNIYDVCYARSERERRDYIAYIDERYNSDRLTGILYKVTEMIGAHVLSVSKHDYDPQGASVTFMIAEEAESTQGGGESDNTARVASAAAGEILVAHLDKSHLTVHTYPEYHPESSIATFRLDIDVSTCGDITPLKTLDFLIGCFDPDIITMDYRVRGFTRDVSGKKLFIDHSIRSIQDFIDGRILGKYDAMDFNVYQQNLFHTRMIVRDLDLENHLFDTDINDIPPSKRDEIIGNLRHEMLEIFSGCTINA